MRRACARLRLFPETLHLVAESSRYLAEIASKSMIYIAFSGSMLGMKICRRCEVVLRVGNADYERHWSVAAVVYLAYLAYLYNVASLYRLYRQHGLLLLLQLRVGRQPPRSQTSA